MYVQVSSVRVHEYVRVRARGQFECNFLGAKSLSYAFTKPAHVHQHVSIYAYAWRATSGAPLVRKPKRRCIRSHALRMQVASER